MGVPEWQTRATRQGGLGTAKAARETPAIHPMMRMDRRLCFWGGREDFRAWGGIGQKIWLSECREGAVRAGPNREPSAVQADGGPVRVGTSRRVAGEGLPSGVEMGE